MLDYDGSGTVGTDEFCDGVIKAVSRGFTSFPSRLKLFRIAFRRFS